MVTINIGMVYTVKVSDLLSSFWSAVCNITLSLHFKTSLQSVYVVTLHDPEMPTLRAFGGRLTVFGLVSRQISGCMQFLDNYIPGKLEL